MSKIRLLFEVLGNQGVKYTLYRGFYEFKRKSGLLKLAFPIRPQFKQFSTLEHWRKESPQFFFDSAQSLKHAKNEHPSIKERLDRINKGETLFFNANWKKLNQDNPWLTNPNNNYKYNIADHWTEIEDISKTAGDIKFVWEKSRFSYLYDVIRADYHFESDRSEFVFKEIENWIDSNPINQGPHYKCSQEISLRCMNWIFALHYYRNAKALNSERFDTIMHALRWQVKHVWSNINFSRICVRNNHAITETMMLYIAGMLFPFFPEANTWKTKGRKWFEEEVLYQIYEDGTFLQFSHNYQRVLVQLLTWCIVLSEKNNNPLSDRVLGRAKLTLNYLKNCCIGENGELPNYGNNDGALFYKLNNQPYTDYRPQLNALAVALKEEIPFNKTELLEDIYWYGMKIDDRNENSISNKSLNKYPDGGIVTIKEKDSFTFFKCAKYKDRPAQADNMHLDLWYKGRNYLIDSGTYKYNTDEKLINYFAGTKGHNSLMLNNENQMLKGPRFIWYNWIKDAELDYQEKNGKIVLEAKATMFENLEDGIKHHRTIEKTKGEPHWIITDEIISNQQLQMNQYWHPANDVQNQLSVTAIDANGMAIKKNSSSGYVSIFYGEKLETEIWSFESNTNKIITEIKIES